MKTIDELTITERAALTPDEVDVYVRRELMEAGVVDEPPPAILAGADPSEIKLSTETWHEVGGLLFATYDEAKAVSEYNAYKADYEWRAGTKYQFAKPAELEVRPIEIVERSVYERHLESLVQYQKSKEARDGARREWQENQDKVRRVRERVAALVEDAAQAQLAAEALAALFDHYVVDADGDEVVAMRFMLKVRTRDDVVQAAEMTGREDIMHVLALAEESAAKEGDDAAN